MNLFKFVLRAAALSAALTVGFFGQSTHADWKVNDVTKRQASFEVKDASIDAYLLAVSKAYNVNLLLDSTHVPQDAPPISQKVEDKSLWASLQSFTARHDLNGESLGDGSTVLLWQQPDLGRLARDLVAGGEIKAPPADTPSQSRLMIHQFTLQSSLASFLHEKKDWNGQRPFQAIVNYEELPDELQARLAVQTRANVWNLAGNKVSPQWFSDDFWKNARLRLIPGRDSTTGQIRQEIALVGVLKREADGSVQEECVYVSEPAMPFHIDRSSRPAVRTAANRATPNNDTVLAASSLAAPYQPAPMFDLAAEAALSQKVTLEVKRQSLDEVVKALSAKSGVALSVAPEVGARGTLLTLGIQEMPLHETLSALARLLGFQWTKGGAGGYSAQVGSRTALDKQLLQGRILAHAMTKNEAKLRRARKAQESQEWATKIRQAVGQVALAQPEGAAFSDLPDDVQSELRERVQTALAPVLVDSQSRLREKVEALNGAWHLEVDAPAEQVQRFTVRNAQGERQIDIQRPVLVRVVAQSGQVLASLPLQDAPQVPMAQTNP